MKGTSAAGHPKNLASGKNCRGINVFLSAMTAYSKGYDSSYWLTYNQAKERGGQVRRGEKSALVVFWKQLDGTDKETGEAVKIPLLRSSNVFSVAQVEGVRAPDAIPFTPSEFSPIEEAEKIVSGYMNGPCLVSEVHALFTAPPPMR